MLLIIRQPLGAAALLSLLGSGLMSAELLACAQLTGQAAWASSWTSDEAPNDLQPGEPAWAGKNGPSAAKLAKSPALAKATVEAVKHLSRMLNGEPSQQQVLEIAWISHGLPAVSDVAGTPSNAIQNRISRPQPDVLHLYGLGAEHG